VNRITSSERWVVIVARNNLDLLKQSVASAQAQDVPVRVLVVDNGSGPDVGVWLRCRRDVMSIAFMPQHSVSRAWNAALGFLFGARWCERVLVINQDSVLRPDTYRWLENEQAMFVTGVGSDDPEAINTLMHVGRIGEPGGFDTYPTPRPDATRPHPDFSCFMISRECYERVGPFDEQFLGAFCEDADMHCRMHQLGIRAYAIDLPFWHVGGGSQTVKRADPAERERICMQADENRERFRAKWGFWVGSEDYYKFFGVEAPPHDTNAE
jgi:GT2 family glycosyltransferase